MFVLLAIAAVILIFGGFYVWAKRQGLLTAGPAGTGGQEAPGKRRISLLTEAVAYLGAILVLAGGAAAIGQRWDSIGGWGHVGVYAGAAVFFFLIGFAAQKVREPALQRLAGVAWFLSVAGVCSTVGFWMRDVAGNQDAMLLAMGAAATVCGAALWLVRRAALQNFALFLALVMTIIGAISVIDASAPSLAYSIALWVFGLAWAVLGWQRYAEPMWVTVPSGAILALIAPSVATGGFSWVYAIGIATAGAAMAISVRLRNTPLLAAGTLAMFGYVTATVIHFFHASLGVPAALAITGVLIICLALVSARLMRATRPPATRGPGTREQAAGQPATGQPATGQPATGQPATGEAGTGEPGTARPPQPAEPTVQDPSHRDLPKAS